MGLGVSISALSDRGLLPTDDGMVCDDYAEFQYPLFRIVDCFVCPSSAPFAPRPVSISALSDRGLLLAVLVVAIHIPLRFNIRSFGSWIASVSPSDSFALRLGFQYPLFRIVDCFAGSLAQPGCATTFQYPLFRIVDCFRFFSWLRTGKLAVSISALSDRGLLLPRSGRGAVRQSTFQYPLFRIVDCFTLAIGPQNELYNVSISALSDRGLLR